MQYKIDIPINVYFIVSKNKKNSCVNIEGKTPNFKKIFQIKK